MKKLGLLLVCLTVFGIHSAASAIPFGGVEFPSGAQSFVDAVVSYEPDFSGGPSPDLSCMPGPINPLGPPDFSFTPLGDGGRITLKFTDNFLTGGGNDEPDLWIFEIGGAQPSAIDERTFVEISKDGTFWHSLGTAGGGISGIDIDGFGFSDKDFFSFVRVTDDPNQDITGPCVGADIDAVGASSSAPVPEPATFLLISSGLAGLAVVRRKFRKK